MTRKDYILIAEQINAAFLDNVATNNDDEKTNDILWRLVANIGNRLEADNSRFDFDRFTTACRTNYETQS